MGGGGEKEGAGLGVVLCTWAGLRFPKTCYQDHRKMLPSRCAPVSRHQDQMWASSLHTPSPLYEAPVHTVPTPSPCHKRSLVVKSICDVRLRPCCPVLHYLLESAQAHVHWVSDAIQAPHPLAPLSPSAFDLSQHQGLFQWVIISHQVARVLELQLQHQSFQWIFRVDFL